MNLFGGGSTPKAETPPSIDKARERVGELKRTSALRGRAASMLTQGQVQAPTAKRQITGN